jgi:3-dehydroquinate synthetase
MEHSAWTNERLDDLAESMRTGFTRVDQDLRGLRTETKDDFKLVRSEIADLRGEMRDEFRALHTLLFRIGGGIIFSLIGVIAAILARGA